MTYFSYLSVQVNTPPTAIFIPEEFPAIFTSPACGRVGLWEILMDIPYPPSPSEDHAAFPQPPLPQVSPLL